MAVKVGAQTLCVCVFSDVISIEASSKFYVCQTLRWSERRGHRGNDAAGRQEVTFDGRAAFKSLHNIIILKIKARSSKRVERSQMEPNLMNWIPLNI